MKKITVCLLPVFLFVFLTGQNLFASAPETENHVQNISHMLGNRGLKKNFNDIYTEAGFLSFDEKQQLYSSFEDKPLAPFLLNWLIGFGIGSFVQKDYLSGGICIAAEITSFGLGIAGFIVWQKEVVDASLKAAQDLGSLFLMVFNALTMRTAMPFIIAGGVLSIASRVYGMIAPWVYGASYNKRLEQALRIGETRLSLAPLVMPDASCGLALRLE
ncbi:MAG: P13 family porin, partial [Treponema sp.]|uniref:P13 family porin n=1 Tax=Treponema sp. TaxID=166 RepID=UPI003FA28E1B